jgi:hypothetical protein
MSKKKKRKEVIVRNSVFPRPGTLLWKDAKDTQRQTGHFPDALDAP